jgi:hypothetical protein
MKNKFELENVTYLSVVRYVSNSLSGENIAIGLLMSSSSNTFFKLSERKIKLAKSMNPASAKLIDFSLNQLKKLFHNELNISTQQRLLNQNLVNVEYLNRLSVYNNGNIQFSTPNIFNIMYNEQDFDAFFNKYISNDEFGHERKIEHVSKLKSEIETRFYSALRDKIDIDYTIKKQELPALIFDFHFDGIGVNGSVCAVKSIDMNANISAAHIRTEISEYESVLERLNLFAQKHGIMDAPKYHLLFDAYTGKAPSLIELSSIISENNMPFFEVNSSEDIDKISKAIIDTKAKKFSELLAV